MQKLLPPITGEFTKCLIMYWSAYYTLSRISIHHHFGGVHLRFYGHKINTCSVDSVDAGIAHSQNLWRFRLLNNSFKFSTQTYSGPAGGSRMVAEVTQGSGSFGGCHGAVAACSNRTRRGKQWWYLTGIARWNLEKRNKLQNLVSCQHDLNYLF